MITWRIHHREYDQHNNRTQSHSTTQGQCLTLTQEQCLSLENHIHHQDQCQDMIEVPCIIRCDHNQPRVSCPSRQDTRCAMNTAMRQFSTITLTHSKAIPHTHSRQSPHHHAGAATHSHTRAISPSSNDDLFHCSRSLSRT